MQQRWNGDRHYPSGSAPGPTCCSEPGGGERRPLGSAPGPTLSGRTIERNGSRHSRSELKKVPRSPSEGAALALLATAVAARTIEARTLVFRIGASGGRRIAPGPHARGNRLHTERSLGSSLDRARKSCGAGHGAVRADLRISRSAQPALHPAVAPLVGSRGVYRSSPGTSAALARGSRAAPRPPRSNGNRLIARGPRISTKRRRACRPEELYYRGDAFPWLGA